MKKRYPERTIQALLHREKTAYLAAIQLRYGDWLRSRIVMEHRRGWYIISAPLFPNGEAPNLGAPAKIEGLRVVLRIRRMHLARAIAAIESSL